jgi:hypothetical protein
LLSSRQDLRRTVAFVKKSSGSCFFAGKASRYS